MQWSSPPPNTHTIQKSLDDSNPHQQLTRPPNVTECNLWKRSRPVSSGTVSVDSKFMSFKPQPPCWGREGVWVTRSAHGCQTLGALPLRRLIIGHLSTLLWSPVELQLRGSDIYFWPLCCLFVSSCVVSCLLRVHWSEMYIWCCSQCFMTGFKETAVDVQMLQHFLLEFIIWPYEDLWSRNILAVYLKPRERETDREEGTVQILIYDVSRW